LFVDYNLYGVIENYLFSGNTKLPNLKHLRRWHRAMAGLSRKNRIPQADVTLIQTPTRRLNPRTSTPLIL
jgi:hypothetical protein